MKNKNDTWLAPTVYGLISIVMSRYYSCQSQVKAILAQSHCSKDCRGRANQQLANDSIPVILVPKAELMSDIGGKIYSEQA